mmetsp:Transcript_96675/g.208578  ORF Transcript_96675/g.208578 Transcript_96675/m.208578 type:complete len:312 (-) Transcript_96675:703-1638(-)
MRTEGTGSSSSAATSSAWATPRWPSFGIVVTAARRTRISGSNIMRQTWLANIWPTSPQAGIAATACERTYPVLSSRHLTMLSMKGLASSPILPRPAQAAPRTAGCLSLRQAATFSAVDGFTVLTASARPPRAWHAAATAIGCESPSMSARLSSCMAAAAPSLPRACAHCTLISTSGEPRPCASLSAALFAASPMTESEAAAAQAGLRRAGATLLCTPATVSGSVDLSSPASERSASSLSTCEAAISPMPPRAAAAAARTPASLLPQSWPRACACGAAFSPSAERTFTAAMRTYASSSPTSAAIFAALFSAA